MAHIVGVPKREPCQKCSLPVFLAERLTIGKKVYHRTCLKCARCSSQLTPGSFYETEIDGEYCCETCPDEEKASSSTSNSKDEEFGRVSVADRLAFFESDGKKVLQKSLSDEEKTQSLKKMGEDPQNVYKPNKALSSFMSNHLTDAVDSPSESSSRRSSNSSTTDSTSSSTNNELDKPPELPRSLPPSLEVDISGTSPKLPSEASLEPLETLNTDSELESVNSNSFKEKETHKESPSEEKPATSSNKFEQSNNAVIESYSTTTTTIITPDKNDSNLSINVTKDSPEDDDKMRTRKNSTPIDSCTNPDINFNSNGLQSTNRSSMVRARLHQFEVMSNKPQDSSISSVSKNRLSDLNKTRETLNDESTVSTEAEVPEQVSNHNEAHQDTIKLISSNDKLTNKKNGDASYHTPQEKVEESLVDADKVIKPSHTSVNENEKVDASESKIDSDSKIVTDSIAIEDAVDSSATANYSSDVKEVNSKLNHPASEPIVSSPSSNRPTSDEYPEELNPFKSDDDEDEKDATGAHNIMTTKEKRKSLNPFESSDEEIEVNKKVKPPRPPPPKKLSTNPFGSETEDEDDSRSSANVSNTTPKRTPIPTPRNYKHTSQNATPEPTPRAMRQNHGTPVKNSGDLYGSSTSLSFSGSANKGGVEYFNRDSEIRGSERSITSSGSSGTSKPRRTKKAPAPPPPSSKVSKELFVGNDSDSKKSSPTSSRSTTPTPRKKRPAPAPPTAASKPETEQFDQQPARGSSLSPDLGDADTSTNVKPDEKNSLEKLSDEEKVLLEKKSNDNDLKESPLTNEAPEVSEGNTEIKRRLIALDSSLLEDADVNQDVQIKEEENVVYRRTIAPLPLDDLSVSPTTTDNESHDRQLEKLKDNKEAKNRNRQSQISLPPEESDPLYNKSIHGKWKRRKGPAPALPVPPKKVLQMLPLQEIRHELEIIEVQQQGLEKQGVMLEKMIRERCEGPPGEDATDSNKSSSTNSKEVEDLILQLFELVNEKNELFRRQAELMYLRRQHRLEQEQADLEYEIRVLMAQPERNKTDSDKAREEALIARLVEVVQLRNEVVECLEMDRLREAEEDMSIKQRLEMHTAKRDEELSKQTPTKLSKKEKKKQKELKKLGKSKKLDADKDADETELTEKQKNKKKKKKFLF